MTELESTISTLKCKLTETLEKQEGLRVESVVVEKIVKRGFSTIFFIKVNTSVGDRRMVAKKTVHHPANIRITSRQNQAVVEFETLTDLYPKYQSVLSCRVPKPVLVIPESEVFVMEFVEGRLLVDEFVGARYFSSRESFFKLKQYYYQCGEWLSLFQQFTGVQQGSKEVIKGTFERCEDKLKIIERAQDRRCPKDIGTQVRHLLLEQLKLLDNKDIQVSGRHGDFGSWNIIVDPNRITVFDFLGYQMDLLPIDLVKMLVYLEADKSYLFYSNKRIECLKSSFLHGYGQLPNVCRPIWVICELLHRVCSICSCIENRPKNIKCRLEQRTCLKNHCEWIENSNRRLSIE
jgi:hypothetical protein